MTQKDNSTANALMEQILNGNKQSEQGEQAIQMPELALRCAQFFHSLSQYCLYFYKNYNREADIHKTKLIKKVDKSKKNRSDNFRKSQIQDKKARAQRGQSEPEPPKKPLTAYILYFQDKKPSFSQKFPSLSLSELTKLIAKDWKDLKQEEKKPYLDKAADDRKRYQAEMNEFKRKYRLGQERHQAEFLAEQNKGSQVLEQKEQQIAIELEQQIEGVEQQNQGELLKSEKSQKQENLQEGANDADQDQEDQEDENMDQSDNNEGQEIEEDLQNDASDEAKIDQEE